MDLSTIKSKMKAFCYTFAALSVSSCIIRNDYNVVFAFLILAIFNGFYKDSPQYYSRIIFQLLAGLIIVDVVWLVITLPYWNSKADVHVKYWESLSLVHTIATILAFIELGLKAFMGLVIYNNYEKEFKNSSELFSLSYDQSPMKN